jgi:hypothetical protein
LRSTSSMSRRSRRCIAERICPTGGRMGRIRADGRAQVQAGGPACEGVVGAWATKCGWLAIISS